MIYMLIKIIFVLDVKGSVSILARKWKMVPTVGVHHR